MQRNWPAGWFMVLGNQTISGLVADSLLAFLPVEKPINRANHPSIP
jgi:hypothetical protein